MRYLLTILGLTMAGLLFAEETNFDLAPLLQIESNLQHTRIRFLGPFYESLEDSKGRKIYAVRPFFSRYEDFSREHVAQDILYPILTYRLNGIRLQQRGIIGVSSDNNIHDPQSSWQDYILPIYFNGRSRSGHRYFAIFPLGGDIRDFFSYKLIRFYGFPFYMKTIKSNNVESYHFLWPIFQKTDGKYVKKRKIFPLIGYSERLNEWRNHFLFWPLFHYGYSLNPEVKGRAHGFFPLYAHTWYDHGPKDEQFRYWSFLFPLFAYSRSHSSNRNSTFMINAPWPFFQYSRGMDGPGSRQLYFWPFWGQTRKRDSVETFFLWPAYFDKKRPTHDGYRRMRYFLIFWMKNTEYNTKTGEKSEFVRFWPLYSRLKRADGVQSIRVLDIFPMRNVHAVDRNLAPLWTIYRYGRTNESYSHDLLWGLMQYRVTKDRGLSKFSVFPLINYHHTHEDIQKLHILLGLYGRKDYPDGASVRRYGWLFSHKGKDGETLGHGFFPLYGYERERKLSILLGLYSRKSDEHAVKRSRYLWLYSTKRHGDKCLGHGLFPFYSKDSDHLSPARKLSILGGLWGRETRRDGSQLTRFLWFWTVNRKGPVKVKNMSKQTPVISTRESEVGDGNAIEESTP